MVLRVPAGAKTQMTLLQLLVLDDEPGTRERRSSVEWIRIDLHRVECRFDQTAQTGVVEMAGRRDNKVATDVGSSEKIAEGP